MLNPREKATVIWFLILILYALFNKNVRATMPGLIKSLSGLMCHPIFILTNSYIVIMFLLMFLTKVIEPDVVKDYIVWIFIALYPMIYQVSTNYIEVNLWRIFIKTFKFSVIPLFIINEYTLSLWTEMIIVPVLFFVGCLIVIADTDEKYEQVKKFLNYVLVIIGLIFIIVAFKGFLANILDVTKIGFWQKMFISFIGITLHIPLLFIIQIMSLCEQIIVRTNISGRLNKIKAIILIISQCKFNKQLLLGHLRNYNLRHISTVKELKNAL